MGETCLDMSLQVPNAEADKLWFSDLRKKGFSFEELASMACVWMPEEDIAELVGEPYAPRPVSMFDVMPANGIKTKGA